MADFSVVVPAHDEAAVIDRCLDAFVPALRPGEAEVVVVANGCSDDTAERARRHPGVRVLDLPAPGKAAALDAGDAAVSALPRVYLDADIVVPAAALRALAAALRGDEPRVAAPTAVFATAGRPWVVRAFYRAYTRLPYVTDGMTGSGVFAVSAAGRARFATFPTATADDLFVQRLFAAGERLVLPGATFTVETPRTLTGLLAVRTRTAFGNAELAAAHAGTAGAQFAPSTGSSLRALVDLVRREPRRAPDAGVYVAVTLVARLRARRRSAGQWDRDDSTR